MTAKRLYFVLLGALAIMLVGLAGAAYLLTGSLQAKSKTLANDRATIAQLNEQQAKLVKSKADIARYSSLEKITKSIVPQDKDQAQAVREITKIAAANDISLTTISFPSSSLGASPTGVASGGSKTSLSQLQPVKNIPGVYNLQITVGNNANNTVTFNQLDAFLRGLENNRRTAAVSSLSIQPQANAPSQLIFTLIINTYIKP